MGRLIELSALRESVRQRYDLGQFSATSWTTDAAIDAELNASLQSFYALLLSCAWDEYFGRVTDLTTTAGVDMSSLPPRFFRLHDLTWLRAPDEPYPIRPAESPHAELSGLVPRDWDSICPRYRLHGMNTLRWLPAPSAAYTVRCTYSALPPDLVADTDPFDAGPGWDEWVVSDVCAKLATREEKETGPYLTRRADAEGRIREQAPVRGDVSTDLLLDDRGRLRDGSFGTAGWGSWELRNLVTRY